MAATSETYVYKTVPGCEICASVYRAKSTCTSAPVLVWIHGGCLMYGSRDQTRAQHIDRYVDSGFAVVSIDYRLAPETMLPGIIEDLEDAFQWMRREGPGSFDADPRRVAVVGHSAGGYLSLMAGSRVVPRPQAIVSFYGYGDIVADWYSKPDPFYCQRPIVSREEAFQHIGRAPIASARGPRAASPIYLYCRQNGLWPKVVTGYDPAQNPEAFTPYCPIRNIGTDYPPTLLLHGEDDTDVPYQQSVHMSEELTRRGIENDLITIRGGPHGFDGDPDSPQAQAAFSKVLVFLKEHLAPV